MDYQLIQFEYNILYKSYDELCLVLSYSLIDRWWFHYCCVHNLKRHASSDLMLLQMTDGKEKDFLIKIVLNQNSILKITKVQFQCTVCDRLKSMKSPIHCSKCSFNKFCIYSNYFISGNVFSKFSYKIIQINLI